MHMHRGHRETMTINTTTQHTTLDERTEHKQKRQRRILDDMTRTNKKTPIPRMLLELKEDRIDIDNIHTRKRTQGELNKLNKEGGRGANTKK